ncbi:MAG: hypothetical protein IIT65_03195, partial [Lachnospiraceae bacterium]|nr:hypothetical protein [Lachnospiraceae bacterium]
KLKMPSIKYSHIFDEEIDRVYECFRNTQLNKDVAYNNFVSKLKFHKGEYLDQENSEFSFFWKKYYDIKMITENVITLPHYILHWEELIEKTVKIILILQWIMKLLESSLMKAEESILQLVFSLQTGSQVKKELSFGMMNALIHIILTSTHLSMLSHLL